VPPDEAHKKLIGESVGDATKARDGELARRFLSPGDAAKWVDQALKKGLGNWTSPAR
jgi:hypothetical protein